GNFENWVGFGDEWDYQEFSLDSAAKLSFNISADDAAKFTIYSLTGKTDKKGVTTYSLKSLQSSALKLNKLTGQYSIDTKALLLNAGTYYIGVQSTNAKKGGDADYTLSLNDSVFYTRGDNGYNNWLYDSKKKVFNSGLDSAGCIAFDNQLQINGDDAWVGFGDEFDYYSFSVDSNMDVSFCISATDAVKVTVYQVAGGKLKSLQSTTVKAGAVVSSKKLALVSGGEYYLGIQSTNAKKGGNAEYSITASEYIAPLNITISGINDSLFDKYDDMDTGCGCSWDMESNEDPFFYHYANCIPKKAKAGKITGTDGHDTVTFAPNVSRYYEGIDLGGGNDSIVVKDSGSSDHDDSEINDLFWSEEPCIISTGDGNDSLYLGGNNDLDCSKIDFGSGNDTLTLGKDAELDCFFYNPDDNNSVGIFFGDGNDKLIGNADSWLSAAMIDLGDGDDCVEIKAGMEIETAGLDFGGGYDTLILNGTLEWREEFKISGLEKVSGSGTIVIANYYDGNVEIDKKLLNLLQNTDIKIVNVLNGMYFAGKEEELGDNTINGRYIQTIDNNRDDFDFWLCGENIAESVDYGFTDEVDYVKFVKTSGMDSLQLYVWRNDYDYDWQNAFDDFSLQLLNSRGNIIDDLSDDIRMADGGYAEDISKLKNGTYYLKFATTANAAYSGYLEIDD
ncbi:MAG: hypothetical protein IKC94_02705, partial [Lentisphaeria bacterium]|nr:hypothetical protein [Lentisphaeria bacterium]